MRINPINGMKKANPMSTTKKIIEIKHLKVDGQIKAIRYTNSHTHARTANIVFNMHKYGNNLHETVRWHKYRHRQHLPF